MDRSRAATRGARQTRPGRAGETVSRPPDLPWFPKTPENLNIGFWTRKGASPQDCLGFAF
jgi:hypothetical protein